MTEAVRPRWLNVVTAAPPAVTTPADLARIAGCADRIELRLDLLGITDPDAVAAWIEASPRPVLATLRSTDEGGAFEGRPGEADALLLAALEAGAWAIDREVHAPRALPTGPDDVVVVASSHTWSGASRAGRGSTYRKRAVRVDSRSRLDQARKLAAEPGFVVPYGPLGALRGLFAYGGLLFGAAAPGSAAADGQPPLCALLDELRAGEVRDGAGLYGLLGDPPGWSPSPALHNSVFRCETRDALYVPVGEMSLEDALGLGFRGFSVTTPGKRAAHRLADALDPAAERSGVVNTLVKRDDGTWHGLDTDSPAIGAFVGRARPPFTGAFVYGAGGYARAAAVVLRAKGYDVRLGARDAGRGEALAARLELPFAGARFERAGTDHVLVNATPAGAVDDDIGFAGDGSLADLLVLDAPYRDAGPTALVRRAEIDGAAAVVEGRALLLEQALHQARAFGARLDEAELRLVMGLALRPPPTLWLVGLRGSGKSSVGWHVARRLGRPFVDLDAEVERVTGQTPAAFIHAHGWSAFRLQEAELFERVRHRRGVVVATGGGLIETEAAFERLQALPCVAYLHVAPATAAARVAASGVVRPRLPDVPADADEASVAYARRDPRYRAVASFVVDASGSRDGVVRSVSRTWLRAISDLLANNAEP